MRIAHTIFAIVFGATTIAAIVLAAEEWVRLTRRLRKQTAWQRVSGHGGQRFRDTFVLIWLGIAWLTQQWGNVLAIGAATSIFAAVMVWNVLLTVRARRKPAPRTGTRPTG